jgi:myo-inositol catabolism protein IolC
MFELLVPATKAQMDRVQADKQTYDLQIRPALMLQTIRTLQDAGVEPDVWKIEGLDRREDCQRVVETARRGARDDVGCIVLGRGANEKKVAEWLETAASVPGFIGFAVGRTTFWDAVADYESNRVRRQEAVARVAHRYGQWVTIFQRAHASLRATAGNRHQRNH